MRRYFHVLRDERAKRNVPHEAFSADGDLIAVDAWAAHALSEGTSATPAEVTALALLHEVLHVVIARHPGAISHIVSHVAAKSPEALHAAALAYVEAYPPPAVFTGRVTPREFLEHGSFGTRTPSEGLAWACEEMLLLWVSSQNPAYRKIEALSSLAPVEASLRPFLEHARAATSEEPSELDPGMSLLDSLLAPARNAPDSVFEQLAWLEQRWGVFLEANEKLRRVRFGLDVAREEARALALRQTGFSVARGADDEVTTYSSFGRHEGDAAARFTPDRDWMPETVIVAKNALVWLAQLAQAFDRPITTLADVPDEALEELSKLGIRTLWLIGLWERSDASRAIKVARGDHDAAASPYAIFDYRIADALGGDRAYEDLRDRAARFGLRLGADMVPNHMGVTSSWVYEHPERFLGLSRAPFPTYRFDTMDLSDRPEISVRLERGYEDRSDAAVVFERRDNRTGETTYLYHGNDGTGLPWNDTAQLDYSNAEVREAVLQCILHVCRMFPVVRFDAAMTLAKRHVRRLWFPAPGDGGAIASRASHALTDEEIDRLCPTEFWRDVVDRVTAELPDTLLVAEAFWMMEGTFVRDFGMHRVYDSAFMHMLRSERNGQLFAMFADVLAEEPEILGRFVHFLSNPDEEPARVGFGTGDKYFGACVMMSTMPGLPLFSHGQIEGRSEKYGMEFRAPRWNEPVDGQVFERHVRDIAPLLRERGLYAGIAHFELFVVEHEHGGTCEDVFAYANRLHGRSTFVLFHNAPREVRVRVRRTVPKARAGGLGSGPRELRDVLGLGAIDAPFVHAHSRGEKRFFAATETLDDGVVLTLGPYGHLVFQDFVPAQTADVVDTGFVFEPLEPVEVCAVRLRAEARAREAEGSPAPQELDALGDLAGRAPGVEELLAAAGFGDHDGIAPVLDTDDVVPGEPGLAAVVVEDETVFPDSEVRVLEKHRDHRPEAR